MLWATTRQRVLLRVGTAIPGFAKALFEDVISGRDQHGLDAVMSCLCVYENVVALLVIHPGDSIATHDQYGMQNLLELTYRRLLCSLKAIGASG